MWIKNSIEKKLNDFDFRQDKTLSGFGSEIVFWGNGCKDSDPDPDQNEADPKQQL